jgi:hypothetical protein
MALSKETVVDRIEVVGQHSLIQVRTCNRILEDGQVVTESYHRCVLSPGNDLSDQDPKVQAVAATVWTPEVVAAYEASLSTPAP